MENIDWGDRVLKTLSEANLKLYHVKGDVCYAKQAEAIDSFRANRQAIIEAEKIIKGAT